ncbi:MAG: hypothetical protein GX282_03920 [Campylobacteraceae bacterium]|nr:hypothetical protein [Campylobacteraceae bacterium]
MQIFKNALEFKNSPEFLKDDRKLLDEFLEFSDLNLYLDNPNRKRFFIKLAKKLEFSDFFIDQRLKEFAEFKLSKGYILVDTTSKKELKLSLEPALTEGDFYDNLSQKIISHFKEHNGFIDDYGQIQAYQVYVFDTIMLYDGNGNMVLSLPVQV